MEIIISDHAEDRLHERNGLRKKSMQRTAERAYEQGISYHDTNGVLSKYMDNLTLNDEAKEVKIYGDKAFIFAHHMNKKYNENGYPVISEAKILVTVIPLPPNLCKKAIKIMKRKKNNS